MHKQRYPGALDSRDPLDALATFESMTPAKRQRTFTHPEYGDLTRGSGGAQLAGHGIHHVAQIERIARA
jgi:hypothetical protein